MCHKLPRICSVCRNCNPVLYSFMTYQSVCDTRVTRRDVTNGAGTAYPSAVPEFTHGFSESHVALWLLFCVVFCISLLCFFVFLWSLYCLPFFDFRLRITLLVSSNFSWHGINLFYINKCTHIEYGKILFIFFNNIRTLE